MSAKTAYIVVGKVGAPHGVKGWVKIHSYTEAVDNILDYSPWYLNAEREPEHWQSVELLEAQPHGNAIIAHFKDCDDRDAASAFRNRLIAIQRAQLPPAEDGEYYWADLEGLKVENLDGVELGQVDHLLETGANDVLVVRGERERLIPYVLEHIVKSVDLDAGVIRVDWDADFE